MIRFVLLYLFAAVAHIACAQQVSQGEYKSWSEFKPDTTAYLNYNWSIASKYRENERNVPLKTFLDDLELPITAVEFKMYNHVIIGLFIHIEPYEVLLKTPIKQRHGIMARVSMNSYPLAAPYEEKIPELKNRDRMKIERVFIKWKKEYKQILENFECEYVVY